MGVQLDHGDDVVIRCGKCGVRGVLLEQPVDTVTVRDEFVTFVTHDRVGRAGKRALGRPC